ncbi:hypothetical protein PDN20_19455 [Bacillus cereus]|nr:hypothetical protein [Bacillus thuringiensis]MDA2150839.1 hypothetical protein [Bacillus cereus]OTY11347.1 hypothetical protein BK734_12205 [Bacillus thuringiensis serovar kim]
MNKIYEIYVHRCFAYVIAKDEEEALSTAQYALESINEVDLNDYFYFHEGENEGKYILCKDYLKEHDYLHLVGVCEVYNFKYESGNIERVPGKELDVHRIEVKRKHSNIYNMAEWMIEKKIKSLKEKQNIYSPNGEIHLYKISFNHDPNDLNNEPTFVKVPLDAFRLNVIVGYLQGIAFDVEIGWGISESDIAYLLSKYFSAVEYKEYPVAADGNFEEFTDVHLFWNWELVVCKYWDEIKELMNLNIEGLLEDMKKLNQVFNDKRNEKNKEYFKKIIIPPQEEFKGCKVKVSNYLIDHRGGNNFYLWRELSSNEVESMKENGTYDEAVTRYDLREYEEKEYVWLANLPTEEDAMSAIKSYWRAIKELSQLDDGDHNEKNSAEENAKYIEDSKDKNKKIAYSYSFNWFDFTYNGKKSDYRFDATIKFNTFEFEEDCIGGVTNYLSARIDLQEEKLITQIDPNVLFNDVEVIDFFIDDTNSGFYKKLNVEEGKLLIKEYCRQAKENKLSHIELTGSPLAFGYVE